MAHIPHIPEADDELAALADELRGLLARPIPPELAERHVVAIVAEAERLADTRRAAHAPPARPRAFRPRRSRRRFAFRVAVPAVATLLAASAALAAVGVRPLDSAFERIGVDLDADPPAAETAAPLEAPRGGDAQAGNAGGRAAEFQQGRPETPGDRRSEAGERNSAPGRATANQVREQAAPPRSPGRSDEHAPPGVGPPLDPSSKGAAPPASPPGETRRATPPRAREDFDRSGSPGSRASGSLRRPPIEE